jgi:hypothetical protein
VRHRPRPVVGARFGGVGVGELIDALMLAKATTRLYNVIQVTVDVDKISSA